MFRKVFAVAGMLVLVSGLCAAAQNLLKNPDFEEVTSRQEIDDWSAMGGDVFETWDKEFHSASYSVKFWWQGRITQKVAATPGSEYELSAWLSSPLSEPLEQNGNKFAKIRIDFLDKDLQVLETARSSKFDHKMEAGRWFEVKLRGIAPPNTAYAAAIFQFFPGEGKGVVLVDDLRLITLKEAKIKQR
ncbi:MAG: hypothetical protein ABII64_04570 [Elusimicrobiota bacterium]